ncbi:unnamed protein product, partial [Durusdinium trenchii]
MFRAARWGALVVGALCAFEVWHFFHGCIFYGCREHLGEAQRTTSFSAEEALRCLTRLEVPHFFAFGDSWTRGVFFDLVSLLNGTEHLIHPGHFANFSTDCTVLQRRPPTNRSKCAGFDYLVTHKGEVQPFTAIAGKLRFTYRLKTFTSDETFDAAALDEAFDSRPPGLVLLNCGLWDMQYPPGGSPPEGLEQFERHLSHFLDDLYNRLGPHQNTRVFWLTLPALASEKLPVRTAGMDWGEASPVRRLPLGHAKQMAGRLPGKVRETSQGIPESNRRRLVV